jgi:hypothetical protein
MGSGFDLSHEQAASGYNRLSHIVFSNHPYAPDISFVDQIVF